MAVPQNNYTLEQGDDAEISLIYETGPEGAEVPVDLTQGYSVRMDIRAQNVSGTRIWTFNSDDIPGDVEVDATGPEDNEATLGADGSIYIEVPRSLSLPGGPIHTEMTTNNVSTFAYDLFLRDPAGKQKKILQGTLTYNKSVTLWD